MSKCRTPQVNAGSSKKVSDESIERRRVRKGLDPTLSKMSAAIAKNPEKFSVENVSKAFAKICDSKLD